MTTPTFIAVYIVGGTAVMLLLLVVLYAHLTRPHPGAHAVPKAAREQRLPASVRRLGGVIGSLLERDPGPNPPAAITLLEDAPSETAATEPTIQDDPREPAFIPAADEKLADPELPADLPEQVEALEYPEPGEDLGPFFEAIARLTGTRTGREQTAEWDAGDMTAVIGAVSEDPALAAAVKAAEEYYAELDGKAGQSMQRFEDAHREEVETAGDTTEQDKRSFHEAGADL
jgi:hypothetical protein